MYERIHMWCSRALAPLPLRTRTRTHAHTKRQSIDALALTYIHTCIQTYVYTVTHN